MCILHTKCRCTLYIYAHVQEYTVHAILTYQSCRNSEDIGIGRQLQKKQKKTHYNYMYMYCGHWTVDTHVPICFNGNTITEINTFSLIIIDQHNNYLKVFVNC